MSDSARCAVPTVEALYEQWFELVWRSLRRLGVPEPKVEDAVQDVFVVVHRRLGDFQHRSSVRTWLFGIVLRVAKDYRRAEARRPRLEPFDDSHADCSASPLQQTARAEALQLVHRFLERLDDDKRAVFVMAELEQMPVREIAEACGINPNTASARLRAARRLFNNAVARHRKAAARGVGR